MSNKVQQFRDEAIKILQEDYPKVKKGMYRLEVFRRRKSRKAVYELRDFLDHIALLYGEDISDDEAEKHIHECRTHLRRCVVEPLEYMAEKQFVTLDRYVRWFAKIPFIIPKNPILKSEFFQKMQEAKELIAEGRIVKTEGKACELMERAFSIETDLLSQVHPISFLIQGLCWIIASFFVGWLVKLLMPN